VSTFLGIGQALMNAPLTTTLTRSMPRHAFGAGLGVYNMLFFVGGGFGAAFSTAVIDLRRDSATALLPLYTGSDPFSEFSDALLPSAAVFLIALVVVELARRANRAPGS
jgi:hypothetical protein